MKSKMKFVLASVLFIGTLTSCSICQKGMHDERDGQVEQCGFSEEANLDNEVEIDNEKVHASPAADRRVNPTVFDEVESDKSFASKSSDNKISKKKERSENVFGAKEKMRVKDIVKAVKEAKKKSQREDVAMMILLVILALILPPLAVGIYEGITGRFWLVLILWLLGIGILAWLLPHLFYLGWILAVILALLIVLGVW
ncbi:MAG: YqaE/Pmp3 family membrane protein [Crocinitomicaceae bacterium]